MRLQDLPRTRIGLLAATQGIDGKPLVFRWSSPPMGDSWLVEIMTSDAEFVAELLKKEQRQEVLNDSEHWAPLFAELEQLRHQKFVESSRK